MALQTNSTTEVVARPNALTVVVDADEFEEALLDPRVHQGNLEATEFLERLEREGRSL